MSARMVLAVVAATAAVIGITSGVANAAPQPTPDATKAQGVVAPAKAAATTQPAKAPTKSPLPAPTVVNAKKTVNADRPNGDYWGPYIMYSTWVDFYRKWDGFGWVSGRGIVPCYTTVKGLYNVWSNGWWEYTGNRAAFDRTCG